MNIAVIGSGPTGYVCVRRLSELGHKVTLIDTSLVEEDEYVELEAQFKNEKLIFGSNLPYRGFPYGPRTFHDSVKTFSSFTEGGLSQIWGATMLPFSSIDMCKWPINFSDLEPYYRELSNWIPIAGKSDQLSLIYNDFISRDNFIPSQRVLRVLENIGNLDNLVVGNARLAVETGSINSEGCYYCNNCLDGCPGSFIWTSFGKIPAVALRGTRVLKVKEEANKVILEGIDKFGNLISGLRYDKVFFATGPIESFRILANSELVNSEATLKDSAFFYIPIYMSRKYRNIKENSFGLSQIFIRLEDKYSQAGVFYQFYDYSESLARRFKNLNKLTKIIPGFLIKMILKKFMIGIGYLDSNFSPKINLTLGKQGEVYISSPNHNSERKFRDNIIKSANTNLSKSLKRYKIFPLKIFCKKLKPGSGVHYGGWLEMGIRSDLLGRPLGTRNIHVVDSSVIPTIPAGPITFSIMANALRITSSLEL